MKKIIRIILLTILTVQLLQAQTLVFPEINDWKKNVHAEKYSADNLWTIINGAAESFIQYDLIEMQRCTYVRPSDSAYFEVQSYMYTNAENAFGIYSKERPTTAQSLNVGAQAYSISGSLNFIAGNIYFKLYSNYNDEHTTAAMKEVAGLISNQYPQSRLPEIISLFPKEGKIAYSEQMIAKDFLGYSIFSNVYQAKYSTSDGEYIVFIIERNTESLIDKIILDYGNNINTQIKKTNTTIKVTDPYNGLIFLRQKENRLYGILNMKNKKKAEALLNLF